METEPIKLQDPRPSCQIDFNTMNSKSKTGSSSVKEKNAPRGVLFRINAKVKVVISIRTNATSVRLALDSKPEFADPAVGKMKYGL